MHWLQPSGMAKKQLYTQHHTHREVGVPPPSGYPRRFKGIPTAATTLAGTGDHHVNNLWTRGQREESSTDNGVKAIFPNELLLQSPVRGGLLFFFTVLCEKQINHHTL